MTDCSSAAVFI